jgi:PAS domain S-box-containing protein
MESTQTEISSTEGLNRAEPLFREIFDLYGVLDSEGRVIGMEGRVFQRTNTDPELLTGQIFHETVFWQSSKNTAKTLQKMIRSAARGKKTDIILDFRASVDQKIPLEITLVPIAEDNGTFELFVCAREITDTKVRTRANKLESESLLSAAENADIGLWYWDFADSSIYSTPRCNELLGLPSYESLTPKNFLDAVHSDDRKFVAAFLDESRHKGTKYEEEFRVVDSDGEVAWISAEGKSLLDGSGNPLKMMGVLRDITEQKIAGEEISKVHAREKKARDEAIEANRAKDFFLAFVSHELRAPLNAILGWSKILLTKDVDEETRRNALETIERSARVQTKLINDLVDSARVASGKLRLEYRPTNLFEVVRGACQAQKPAAETRGIDLEFRADKKDVIVFGDANRLQQVFGNLISNAIKFTPEGGSVTVSIDSNAHVAAVTVEDTGQGIETEALSSIFRQFSQGGVGQPKNSSGLGLGLSIAKILAERHGGSITVDSPGLGGGAKFTVTLPITDPESRIAQPTAITEPDSKLPLEGLSIMIVEDDPDSREVLQLFLEQSGATVTAAPNAKSAYLIFVGSKGRYPDLMISDLAMPEEDGYSLIERIRELPADEGGAIPAIALSAFGSEESRQRAVQAGFQRYSTKPFEPDQLVREVLDTLKEFTTPKE